MAQKNTKADDISRPIMEGQNSILFTLFIMWTVIGASFFIVLFLSLCVGIHSTLELSTTSETMIPLAQETNVAMIVVMLMSGFLLLCVCGNYRELGMQFGTLKKVLHRHCLTSTTRFTIPIFAKTALVVMPTVFMVTEFTSSFYFYNLDIVGLLFFVFVFEYLSHVAKPALDEFYKEIGALTDERLLERRESLRRNSMRRASKVLTGIEVVDTAIVSEGTIALVEQRAKNRTKMVVALFMNIMIMVGYPFTVITLFRSVDVVGRMAIVLFLHPLIMEFLMHGYRASVGKARNGLGDEINVEPVRDLVGIFIFESYLVLCRRIMLCNLGSFQATTIAIIITGIEETLFRTTIERRDIWYHEIYLTNPPYTPDELRKKKDVWAAAIFYSMIAETSAIFISTLMFILYADSRMIFDLGYDDSFTPVDSSVLILQTILELFSELAVDSICTYVELKNDINVLGAINKIHSSMLILGWSGATLFSSFYALNAFKTVPNFVYCSSRDPCDCNAHAFRLYQPICDAVRSNNITSSLIPDTKSEGSRGSFASIANMTTVIIGALVVLVMVAIICTSLTWIQRKKEKREYREMEQALKAKELTPEQAALVADIMRDDFDANASIRKEATKSSSSGVEVADRSRRQSISSSTLARLEIRAEQIKITKNQIGRGAFGDVHKAEWNGVDVAIKQLTKIETDTMKAFRAEVLLMSQLRHPNIITLMGALWGEKMVGIVLEFATGGALDDALKRKKTSSDWTWRDPMLRIITDVAQGMNYLHSTQYFDEKVNQQVECVLHRDLKPGNVLLTTSFAAKVADFGSSKAMTASSEMTLTGTPIYMAPEVVRGEAYGKEADVYSFGVLIFAMTCDEGDAYARFADTVAKEAMDTSNASVMMKVANEDIRPDLHQLEYRNLRALIKSCWMSRSSGRLTFNDIFRKLEKQVRDEIYKKADADFEKLREEKKAEDIRKKELISRARTEVRQFKAPLVLMRAKDFLSFSRLTPFEALRDVGKLKSFDDMTGLEAFLKKNYTIFFSHQWLGWSDPDPSCIQFEVMKSATVKLSGENSTLEKAYVWFDYGCIPQKARQVQMLAVSSLPAVSSSLHAFVIVAPSATHLNTSEECSVTSYNRRGWCRAEVTAHASRRGFNNMYLATSESDIQLVNDDEYNIGDAINIFQGDFTCCRLQHPNHGACDREELLEPMLGLYCDVYKRRFSPRMKRFYDEIEHCKSTVFPEEIEVVLTDGVVETRPLFKDLIDMVEKTIDFENMIEAAGGEKIFVHTDVVDFKAEEKGIFAEDEDLKPILLNTNELDVNLNSEEEILLGRGAFGKVVKGSYRNHAVAVKVMHRNNQDQRDGDTTNEEDIEEDLARFRQECVFMKDLKHENIVMLIGAVWSEELICCVIEYCERGDLDRALSNTTLTWEEDKLDIAINISSGMNYLHGCVFFDDKTKRYVEGVVHRDLKPSNVLLTGSGIAKISDMGESRVLSSEGSMTIVGTPFFMAPEVALGERYDERCDVFSFGMILAEMCQLGGITVLLKNALLHKHPKTRVIANSRLLNSLLRNKIRPEFVSMGENTISTTPEAIYSLMRRCWSHDGSARPSFEDILSELNEIRTQQCALVRAGRSTVDNNEMERLKKEHMEAEMRRKSALEEESRKAQEKLRERMKRVASLRNRQRKEDKKIK